MKQSEKIKESVSEDAKLRKEIEDLNSRYDISRKKLEEAEKRIQELLRLSEVRSAEFDTVIEAIPDAVYIGNMHGVTHCNTKALKMLGANSVNDLQERIGELGKKFNVRWRDTGRMLREDELQFTRALNGETVNEEVLATNATTGEDVHIMARDVPVILNSEIIGAVAINSDITNKIESARELEKTKGQYEILFNSIEEGFAHYKAIYDGKGMLDDILVIEINPSGAKLSGKTRGEQVGKTWKQLWTGIEDSLFDIYREVDKTGKRLIFEHFSGITQRWYTNTIYKIGEDQFAVNFYDITERKDAEEALRTREAQLDAFFANSPAILNLVDENFCYINTDPLTPTYYGLDRETIKGKSLYDLSSDFLEQTGVPMKRVLETGDPILNAEFSAPVPGRGGEPAYWHTSFFRVPLGTNNWGVGVISYEVTDIRRSEERLKESEERFRLLADNISQFAWTADKDGTIKWYNKRWFDYTGTTFEEVKGWGWTRVHHPEHVNRVMDNFKKAVKKGESWEDTFPLLGKDGKYRWFLSRALPIRDEKGSISTWFGTNTDITERLSTEETLKENEQRLKGIYDNAAVGITETDQEDRFLDVNERLCRILEYTREELKGKSVYEITFPEDWQQTADMNKRLHNGEPSLINYEKRYIKKDGTPFWVHVTGSAILDSHGKFLKSINTIEDISERKNAEEAMRRSDTILKQAGNMANLGAWEIELRFLDELNKNPLYWSDQVFRIFGYKPGSVPVSNNLFYEHVHTDDRQKVAATVVDAIKNRCNYNLEHRIIRTDGDERIVFEHAEILYDRAGKPLRITGAIQDITRQKQTEKVLYQALHEAEEGRNILTALMEYIPIGITIADAPDVNIRMVSKYGQNLLEKPDSEITGIPAPEHPSRWGIYRSDGVTPATPEELPLSRATMKCEIVKNEEWYITRSDGILIPILCNSAPILDKNGKVVGGVIGWQDIADLKRIEKELKQSNEEMIRFLYTVSHDLKSPLVTIKMFTSYLRDDIRNSDHSQSERDLSYVENAADKMGILLDELLELSRVGRKEEKRTEVSLEKVVKDAVDLVAGRISEKKVKIIHTAPPVILSGYTQRFLQLYQNLIDNAAKFMGDQPKPEIETGAYIDRSRNDEIVLFVRDNGMGIDPQLQNKLFGLFEKLDPGNEGTGLGLALVKRIIEVHGGKIWVYSEGKGKGTTFYFTLKNSSIKE